VVGDATAEIRERLESELAAVEDRMRSMSSDMDGLVDASRNSNADDEHDPEGATIAYERSQLATLLDQARAHRQEVEAALGRLDGGTYGACVVCGEPIPPARLEARPSTRTCVRHALS
jgi:DnaK suppressor protein